MEVLKENPSELDLGSSTESFQKLLDSQKELFHSQIDQLQNIVVTQCKLTGVNPLSQEMAAGALSIKIGKRPRDLLNPKAVKYMQSVFSIKDAISKKESREISALFGVTVTQVREFFTSQRSRVRKLVRLSREKAIRSNNACKELQDGVPTSSDPMIPIDQVPLNSVGPAGVEEAPSCSTQDETLPGIDDSDKHFLENIFSLMRKEETFSGQVKLMEWILQIENSSVLYWFLTRGGVMILATWLSQAAIEEQTSVLVVILKVLCHLPLHKALPVHMSAILQSVNRLRFYRTSDISNRARVLLSRWSKIFARSQAWKKPNVMKSSSDPQKERLSCQRIGEIMGDESWQSKIDLPEEILAPSYSSENFRKLESPQALKLLPASTDDSNRKHIRGVSSSQTRERRKVLLVEQPGQKTASRSMQVARAVPANQGRPMSADDIQKAKMRALFMQSKYGKTAISSNESLQAKTEGLNRSSSSQTSILLSAPKAHVQPKIEEREKPVIIPSNSNQREAPLDSKPNLDLKEPLWEKCKRVQIPWQTPPELRINGVWRVGGGENSKDVEVQKNRIRREKEIIYQTVQEIPSDPKEPWDLEMDYDDTLTPEIPTVQLPDGDGTETLVSPREDRRSTVTPAATSSSQIGSASASVPEPDLELLAILLKNPELVFALTSGQGGGLSSEETVRLLDMIKTSGMGLQGTLNGLSGKAEEMVEVSLPSPTPSSNPGTSGWKPEVAKNPFSQRSSMANRDASAFPGVAATIRAPQNVPSTSMVWPQISTANITPPPPQPATVSQFSQRFPATMPPFSLPQTTTVLPKKRPPSLIPSLHQRLPTNSAVLQTPASEIVLSMTNFAATNSTLPNFSAAASPSLRVETLSNVKPAPVSIILNTPERQPITFPLPPLLPTPTRSQPHPQPPVVPEPPVLTPLYPTRSIGKPGSVSDSWSERQGLASNPHTQVNQNNYNAWAGGSMQPPMLPGPPWERNEFVGEAEFETWSPEGSPIRSPEYMSGRNFLGPRMNSERNYRPERSRLRSSSGYQDQNRHGNRRWRDRRR